eukprot:CAMPEP_0180202874 /NCGR_PEP_ID=MMETSP0987-20121128/7545_1 /TAXON_ID=697907 /ORGANISM="non described non described, Strain CCMP2293" /LENGTH=49 /DNA_ID=CAMNT_0022158195 /DNA_START=44 /DNA_END=193 /DNA_ORIENTATION=-
MWGQGEWGHGHVGAAAVVQRQSGVGGSWEVHTRAAGHTRVIKHAETGSV